MDFMNGNEKPTGFARESLTTRIDSRIEVMVSTVSRGTGYVVMAACLTLLAMPLLT